MKILLAVHHFPPHYTGGAEWEAYNTAQALAARGHAVQVLCVERVDEGNSTGLTWSDEIYEGLPVRRLSYNLAAAPDPARWEYDNEWIGDHLRALIAEYRPDVFHLMGGYLLSGRALRVARALGVPTVLSLMDFWFLCPRISMWRSNNTLSTLPIDPVNCARCLGEEQRRYRWLGAAAPTVMQAYWRAQTAAIGRIQQRQAFLREALAAAHLIICRSQFVRQMFIEAGAAPEPLRFLRQGRDFPSLTAEQLEKSSTAILRVGYLGQIAPHKGVHILLQALRRAPRLPLIVRLYGNLAPFPKYSARLRQFVAEDPRARFAGMYHSPAELQMILRDLDVIVVPSVWYENSPNVILEALAHRTPVIVSNLGGMAELVRDGENGLHFIPNDPADLARVLQRLVEEPDLRARLRARHTPIQSVAEEMDTLEELYRQASEEAHAPRP
jgi:glycosyltransferase involved in cell wall biosynthesis